MKKASKIMRVEDSERTEVELKAFFFNSLFLWMIVYDCNHISSFFFFDKCNHISSFHNSFALFSFSG